MIVLHTVYFYNLQLSCPVCRYPRCLKIKQNSKHCSYASGEHTYNEETDGNRTFSDGEGDTSRATDPDSALSPKKEKKKKGLRTPSFLKKKKKDKKKEKDLA